MLRPSPPLDRHDLHGGRELARLHLDAVTDRVTWHELPNTPWPPRHPASAFVYDSALCMVPGNNMFPDVWKLTRAK